MGKTKIQVGILVGSDSDLPAISSAAKVLEEFDISFKISIASAHRTPEKVKEFIKKCEGEGAEVFIAAAGMAAALPGVVASVTTLPVIGVPLESKALAGIDALFSIVQMPRGIPVATVSIGKAGAANAGVLAARILSIKYPKLKKRLIEYRNKMARSVNEKDSTLQQDGINKYIKRFQGKL
jgi:5-(carboxyamino)imidazole ribonucleotide mutase